MDYPNHHNNATTYNSGCSPRALQAPPSSSSPGEWFVKQSASGNLFIYSSQRTKPIAGVAVCAPGIDRVEAEANARFLAASKRLFQALAFVLTDLNSTLDGETVTIIRAAMASASVEG